MAIDTAPKRRSAAGVPFLPLGPGVTPDAATPLAWRQQAGWGYSGVAAGEEPVVTHPPASAIIVGYDTSTARVAGRTS